jgi:hypothetical protein
VDEQVQADGWWWEGEHTTHRHLKRQVVKEMRQTAFGFKRNASI